MRQATNSAPVEWTNPFATVKSSARPLANVVYRSRAVRPLSPPELHDLTRTSQARNGRESISGLMLYDNENFYQWLEGPPDSVNRVMGSICADPRHTDIKVVENKAAETRTFGGWTMKLATKVPSSVAWRRDVIEPPREIVEGLRKRPEAAPVLLSKLLPLPTEAPGDQSAGGEIRLNQKTAATLRRVILSQVIPQLAGYGDAAALQPGPQDHPRAAELAELLVSSEDGAARELITELRGAAGRVATLYATLFEPAARRLGDMWGEDTCSDFDVTLGLCRLQNAIRLLAAAPPAGRPGRSAFPVVLVAPEPGELHHLGAALDGSVLRDAGWLPHCEYPTDDRALQDLVSSTWFDVLDLSLSTAFRREHVLPRMTETIAQARRASCNPGLMVIVGGRIFVEETTAGLQVGADVTSTTALGVDRSILRAVGVTRTDTPVAVGQVSVTPC